jgi:hypothetical protein
MQGSPSSRRRAAFLVVASVATLTLGLTPGRAAADLVFPSAPNGNGTPATYMISLGDLGEVLGSTGASNLPAGASASQDALIGLQQFTSITRNGGGPNLIPAGTSLVGMYNDLRVIAHVRPNGAGGFAAINDITPGGTPLSFKSGDVLYFGPSGRNPLNNAGPSGSGGYLLVSDNKTGFSFNALGSGARENPQNLILGSGGFTVNRDGTVTGTPDNYSNAAGKFALDTSHVVFAGKFQAFSTLTGVLPPSGFPIGGNTLLANAPPGTVFAEVGTTPVSPTDATALSSVGFGYLAAVGGSSADSFAHGVQFTTDNTAGAVPLGGPADLVAAIQSQFNVGLPPDYTQFQSSSNDPLNFIGAGLTPTPVAGPAVPEPSTLALFSLCLLGLGLGYVRRLVRPSRSAE